MNLEDMSARMMPMIQMYRDQASKLAIYEMEAATAWADYKCESPIEMVFGVAWRMHLNLIRMVGPSRGRGENAIYASNCEWSPPALDPLLPTLQEDFIGTQISIGNYRADFILVRSVRPFGGEDSKPVECRPVIVELDGHDFHERTKEQASRDKERDRELQALGFAVLRFTGSEIWGKIVACIESVNHCIHSDIERKIIERRGGL